MKNIINSIHVSGYVLEDSLEIIKLSGSVIQLFHLEIDVSYVDKKTNIEQIKRCGIKCKWYGGDPVSQGDHVVVKGRYAVDTFDDGKGSKVYIFVEDLIFIND
jgi:hypothetical protein